MRLALITEFAVPLRQPAFEEGQGEIMTRKISLIIGALAVFVLSLTIGQRLSTAAAQSNAATLTGTVNDPTGAVIPKATVIITDEASGVARNTTSDEAGFFSLVGVPVGNYDVKVSASGFNSLVRRGVAVPHWRPD